MRKYTSTSRRPTLVVEPSSREALPVEDRLLFQDQIVEQIHGGIATFDFDGKINGWNHSAERITGRARQDVLGCNVRSLLPVGSEVCFEQSIVNPLLEGQHSIDIEMNKKTGERVVIRFSNSLLKDRLGGEIGVICYFEDITDIKRSEDKIRENNRQLDLLRQLNEEIIQVHSIDQVAGTILPHLRKILDCSRVSISLYDPLSRSVTFQAIDSDGKTSREIGKKTPISQSIDLAALARGEPILIADYRCLLDPTIHDQQLIEDGLRSLLILPLRTQDTLNGSLNLSSTRVDAFSPKQVEFAHHIAYSIALVIDNINLFKQIHIQREKLKYLICREACIQENERKRFSRELHDDVGQSLTALKINLDLIDRGMEGDRSPLHQSVQEATELLRKTIEKIRLLARDMRPPELDTLGLPAALEDLCQEYRKRLQINIHYQVPPFSSTLSDPIATCCYRLIQEAFSNIAKHAAARNVWIILNAEDSLLHLTIQDDGRGFDANRVVPSHRDGQGLGLLGMRERLELLNGRLEVRSEPGQGTSLSIHIPLEAEP